MVKQINQQKQGGKVYQYIKYVYFADNSQQKYLQNRKNCGRRFKWISQVDMLDKLDELVNKENRYSPDVALYLLRKSETVPLASIPCTSTLYNWIDQRFLQTKNMDLLLKTRRSPKKKRVRKNKILLGLSIEKRPTEVDKREVFGHWEIDTVIGTKEADEPVLLTLIERKTRFELILKPTSKQASAINHELEGLKRK